LGEGENGIVNVWDVGAQNIKQSIQVGSVILAVHWADIVQQLLTFLVGAHDGSVTLYQSVIFLSVDGFIIDDESSDVRQRALQTGFQNFHLRIVGLHAHGLFKSHPRCRR
jgi:hypothetical protein